MTWGIIGLVAAYALILLLLANVVLFAGWSWKVKIASAAMVAALFYVTWQSIPPLTGWPTAQTPPRQFNLMGLHVEEPDKNTGAQGTIYLWVVDIAHEAGRRVPRAHALPFSPQLHAKVTEAGNKLRKNLPQLGEVASGTSLAAKTGMSPQHHVNLHFFDMPDPLFPEK